MSEIRITKQTSVTFYGSFNLADLRSFLAQCEGIDGKAAVQVNHHDAVNQRDDTSTTITVLGAA